MGGGCHLICPVRPGEVEEHPETATSPESLGQQLPASITPFSFSFFCTLFWSVHEPRGGNDRVNGSGTGGAGRSYRCYAPRSNIRGVQEDTHTRTQTHQAARRQRGSGRDALLRFLQDNMPYVWIFSPYKLSHLRTHTHTHTHAIKGRTHTRCSPMGQK